MSDDVPLEKPRLVSLDALRGFDMFWIIGADSLVVALNEAGTSGLAASLAQQFEHVDWEGFRFYDLIFPLFVFLMGVAVPLSLDKALATEGRRPAVLRILRRSMLLFFLGFLYKGGFSAAFDHLQYMGVLQRIALCYAAAGICYVFLRPRDMAVLCGVILLGYWALLSFVPVPAVPALTALNPEWGLGGRSFAYGNNWSHYLDYSIGLTRTLDRFWYSEGLFSTIPAVATALCGVFAGIVLRGTERSTQQKALLFLGAGIVLVATGYLWGLQFPIIKKLWTSSFVVVAAGYSFALLGVFMVVIDVWGYRRWTAPFLWIGSNALTLYMVSRFVDFKEIAGVFVGGDIAGAFGSYGEMLQVMAGMGLILLLARFLYVRRIFLRV